jgi:DNA-binding NarL/FixJ family response regulator
MNPLALDPTLLPELMHRLTIRQLEIVSLLAEGKKNSDIATILSIGVVTVKVHINRAYHKLGLENRIQLIVVFTMWKMLSQNGNKGVTNP